MEHLKNASLLQLESSLNHKTDPISPLDLYNPQASLNIVPHLLEWVFLHCVYANHVDAKVYRAMLQTPRFYFQTNESPRVKLVLRLALFPGWLSKLTSFIFKDIRPWSRFSSTTCKCTLNRLENRPINVTQQLTKIWKWPNCPTIQQLPTYCCRGPKSCQCSDWGIITSCVYTTFGGKCR